MHPNTSKISHKKVSFRSNVRSKKKKLKSSKKDIKRVPKINEKVKSRKVSIKKRKEKRRNYSKKLTSLDSWAGLLEGHTAFILGNAPSIEDIKLDVLNNYLTIGINRIFFKYDPTILIWQDKGLWNSDKNNILKQKAIKVCSYNSDPRHLFNNFIVKTQGFRFSGDPSKMHGRGNTAALAVQFAVALGCSHIVLLGTDCKYRDGKTNFYGKNKDHKSYTLKMCRAAMKWIVDNTPVPVYNCSDNNYLQTRKVEDVIQEILPPKISRKEISKLLGK